LLSLIVEAPGASRDALKAEKSQAIHGMMPGDFMGLKKMWDFNGISPR